MSMIELRLGPSLAIINLSCDDHVWVSTVLSLAIIWTFFHLTCFAICVLDLVTHYITHCVKSTCGWNNAVKGISTRIVSTWLYYCIPIFIFELYYLISCIIPELYRFIFCSYVILLYTIVYPFSLYTSYSLYTWVILYHSYLYNIFSPYNTIFDV